jgi:hypothetical protein
MNINVQLAGIKTHWFMYIICMILFIYSYICTYIFIYNYIYTCTFIYNYIYTYKQGDVNVADLTEIPVDRYVHVYIYVNCLQIYICIRQCFEFLCSLLMPNWLGLCVLRRTCRQNRLYETLFHTVIILSKYHHHHHHMYTY